MFSKSMLLIFVLQFGACFGYVCIHNPCNFHVLDCHNHRDVRLMAKSPSSSSVQEAMSATDEKESRPTRLSKRERLSSLIRRLRLRLPSFLKQPVPVKINETPSKYNETNEIIINSRQSKAADGVDLSGSWKPIVTAEFKKEYDSFLVNCSESFMFRKVVVNGIGYQKEVIRQLNNGIDVEIVATNPAGNWNRTLVASDESRPLNVTITDPDGDKVHVEAWWEGNGTRHKSLLQGKPRVKGGVFETARYLESNNILVCESRFHPAPSSSAKFKHGYVLWKFQRDQ